MPPDLLQWTNTTKIGCLAQYKCKELNNFKVQLTIKESLLSFIKELMFMFTLSLLRALRSAAGAPPGTRKKVDQSMEDSITQAALCICIT